MAKQEQQFGFILGNIVLAFFANGSTEVLVSIKEIVVASIALFLIPKDLSVILDDLFDYNRALPGDVTSGCIEENTIFKIGAMSDVISDIASNVGTSKDDATGADEVGSFIKTLNENTCRRCENYEKCWKENFHKMYETTFDAIETMQVRGEVRENDLNDSCCEHKMLFADGLNLCFEMYKMNRNWQEKVKAQRTQMAVQLKEVSGELNKVKEEISSKFLKKEDELEEVERTYKLELRHR